MTATISGDDRVEEAELVEGIVRVKSTTNHRPRVLLETHYFWRWEADDATVNVAGRPVTIRQADIGVGPFVAIQTSGEDILEAFGMGVMWGFRREGSSSFNIGAGFLLDPKVKVLGGDIVLPQEYTEWPAVRKAKHLSRRWCQRSRFCPVAVLDPSRWD